MNIVFDNIVFNMQKAGGVSRFWSNIISPYLKSETSLFIEKPDNNKNLFHRNIEASQCVNDHPIPNQIARYLNFKRQFFNDDFIFHSSYFRVNSAIGCKNVTTVHDLMYEKFRKDICASIHIKQKNIALQCSDAIVCVSEHTRQDLYEFYPFCKEKLVTVIPNGVEGFHKVEFIAELSEKYNIKNPNSYFLYVGHRGWIKRFDLVFEAIGMLGNATQCVVVGDPFSKNEMQMIHDRGYENLIINVGKVNDKVLNCLYSQALFYFFPTEYEGFGIPPLEAMLTGCPVLASNRSSVPEVVGKAAVLFDPSDIMSLKAGIEKINEKDVRVQLTTLGFEHASKFTWKSVTDSYDRLYSSLLEGSL
jgi:mannosyltransferase